MTTPLDLAQNMARDASPEVRAYAVAIIARGLSDADPADPLRMPWEVDIALPRAATFLGLAPEPQLLARARELMPIVSDAAVNRGVEPEWCLHCGSYTCEHAIAHNRAYGSAS